MSSPNRNAVANGSGPPELNRCQQAGATPRNRERVPFAKERASGGCPLPLFALAPWTRFAAARKQFAGRYACRRNAARLRGWGRSGAGEAQAFAGVAAAWLSPDGNHEPGGD